ncbi:MAG: NYN domain-containing protein [Desulfobacterales bacterium]|jgi:predicted RNA-binding protein with PIN domain
MPIHIIIDGYNLIRQSEALSVLDQQDIRRGREALVNQLSTYRKIKSHRITVVFDARHSLSFSRQNDRQKGIAIRFSRRGESADDVIKRMAQQEREKALVVSSDREIVDFAALCGAATISAPQFEDIMQMATRAERNGRVSENDSGRVSRTKKKGPSRRLSKRLRRNRIKIKKL